MANGTPYLVDSKPYKTSKKKAFFSKHQILSNLSSKKVKFASFR